MSGAETEDRIAVAPNWKLVWWRFRRHYLAMGSAALLLCLSWTWFTTRVSTTDTISSTLTRPLT